MFMRKRRILLTTAVCVMMAFSVGCSSSEDSQEKGTSDTTTVAEESGESSGTNSTEKGTEKGTQNGTSAEGESSQELSGEQTSSQDGSMEGETTTVSGENGSSTEATSKNEQGTTKKEETTTSSSGNSGSTATGVTDFGVVTIPGKLTTVSSRVSVHDPSIEYDPVTKKWYIFGSHTAFASTSNLINWTLFEQENATSQTKYANIFKESQSWSARGGNYSPNGNLWAPDVIYNKDMGKWCMYMSMNGNNHYSSIAMATADNIAGPYTYKGTVVYSGMTTADDVNQTDYKKVTGSTDVSRYTSQGWWYYGTNAIDPCVLYDKNGQLWMVYGSWFGGLFVLKLDNETGLRDYTYTYSLDTNASDGTASDPYLGKRISGGYGGTGEGPYIVWDEEAGYYYMYVSYCGLNATDGFSGYQMRLFRSKNIDGPYLDAKGNNAIRTSGSNRYDQADKGIKIMGNYKFTSLATAGAGPQNGYRSPGHNSAIIDNDGNRFLIYHTRFNGDSEWHQLRVHQQFLNEDGWLVTAPYEYLGSKIKESGYSQSEIVGSYELIDHGNEITFDVVAPMLPTYLVNLNSDGTITGDYEGTWSQKSGTCYATLKINGVTYKGVFFKQYDESSSHKETMTFTVIGSNNIALWGSRIGDVAKAETGKQVASYTFETTSNLGKDYIGTVGSATINGCTAYSDSQRGNVLKFDGQDDYVQLAAKATEYDSYTIMMWYKSSSDAVWQRIFDLGHASNSSMFLTSHAYQAGIRFAQQINGDGEKIIEAGVNTTLDKWTHVALTVNSSTKIATLYVNGSRVGGVALSALPEAYNGTINYLGKSQYPDPYFSGYMDNVFIFDYALSQSEISTYMNK